MTAAAVINAVLAIAASQIGYFRRPGTTTKFGTWYGLPTGQWCAMYVSWCAAQAGIPTSIIPRHAYTPSGVNWFKERGRWHKGTAGIRRGDIAYFDFPGAPNRVSHVAWVESVSGKWITTLEGNTSGPSGDQRNGGACLRKVRSSYIVGYGRPDYAAVTERPYLQRGDTGDKVVDLQNQLIAAGFSVGAAGADGDFGPATEDAVRALQESRGLDVDGVAGKDTFSALGIPSHTPAPMTPVFHGTPGVHTGRLTADGNYELVVDGDLGDGSIARWQQVMGTPIDNVIDQYPTSSSLIVADQKFLNSVVDAGHIANLDPVPGRRKSRLDEDGFDDFDGTHTSAVRQFWLRNAVSQGHQVNLIGKLLDYDSVFGEQSKKVLQFALNHATAGSKQYGRV